MGTKKYHVDNLLNYASQDEGGEAEDIITGGLQNTYRRILGAMGQEQVKREFSFTTSAKTDPDTPVFSGDGLDDLTAGGTYTGDDRTAFTITVDAESTTDTFKWQQDGGTETTGVSMTGSAQTLAEGVTITFAATTGHTDGESWSVVVSMYSQYGLPMYVRSELNFDDPDNDRSLVSITSDDYDKSYPGTTTYGEPTHYYRLGNKGVKKQIVTAGVVSAVSSLAADDGSRYVTFVGFDSSGTMIREKVTLDGTTKATTSASFTTLERCTKTVDDGYTITGNITITDAGSVTLAVIPTWVKSPTYVWVEFHPAPDDPITYVLRAMSYRPELANDDDWPEFDEYYHDLLEYGTGQQVFEVFGKPELGARFGKIFDDRMKEFKLTVDPKPNLVQTFGNVQMSPSMPRYPWIKGVHYGLADSQ